MKIKILIPVYNDWQSVFKLLENINSEVSNLGYEFSVIIINDASTESRPELSSSLDNLNSIKSRICSRCSKIVGSEATKVIKSYFRDSFNY